MYRAAAAIVVCTMTAIARAGQSENGTSPIASQPSAAQTPKAAADRLRVAWERIDEELRAEAVEAYTVRGTWEPAPDFQEILPPMQEILSAFESVAEGALEAGGFDWGLPSDYLLEDRSLKHVAMIRAIGRLLVEDAARHANAGDLELAVMRMAGALRLAASLRTDGYVFSSAVACGMLDQFAVMTGKLLRDRSLSESARARLAAAVDAFPVDDEFGFVRFMREYPDKFALTAARAGIAVGRSDLGLPALADDELTALAREAMAAEQAAQLAESERQSLREFFEAVEQCWQAEDPTEAFERVKALAAAGEFHKLAPHLLPQLVKAHQMAERSSLALRDLRALAKPDSNQKR